MGAGDQGARQPLRHADWTRAAESTWPARLQALALRRVGVALAIPGQVDLERWLPIVREARLVPGLRVAAGTLDPAAWRGWTGRGPLLLALHSGPDDGPETWRRLRTWLATTRDPHLRLGFLDVPACHSGPARPDVPLRQTRAGSTDPRCRSCGVRRTCAGPSAPTQPVEPQPEAVSNQFDLVQADAGPVQLADGRQFTCDPQTWARPEVQRAITRGQLYLDVSDKPRLDDFAADLRLLTPDPHGAWQVAASQPFAEEEALLRAHLRDLRGLVVDIGAGPIRYLEELRDAMRAGRLQYLAVEPDAAHLARARAALPEGRMVQGTGEHLPLRDGCADAVLFLRSVNHLHDLAGGLREAARVLRPGGVLILVDNVAFGLLRTPEQIARAHAIPLDVTPFEHFRNADASEVADLLRAELGPAVTIQACHPVRRGGSNQWLLRATVDRAAVAPHAGRR